MLIPTFLNFSSVVTFINVDPWIRHSVLANFTV